MIDQGQTKKTWPVILATPESGRVLAAKDVRGEIFDAFNVAANELIGTAANFQG